MTRTAVQFGAGNIGRGFLAQLFHESGLEVVFIDVSRTLLEAVNREGEYSIHIVGEDAGVVTIDRIRAIDGADVESVAEAVAECEVACTAVGAAALRHIAPSLARGLETRFRRGGGPLNILICENLHDAAAALRSDVSAYLPPESRDVILEQTGFVQAVVSRMVPLQESAPDEPLKIRVESYKRLPVDALAVKPGMPDIRGVEPVSNFEAHVQRKLYTHNCAHATLGYLGYRRGLKFGHEALADPEIRRLLHEGTPSVLGETGAALIRKHRFDSVEHDAHVKDLMRRFGNEELGDTCFRLARDPLRKLAPNDRLVGAARLCESQGVRPAALSIVIGEALHFDSPGDPSAVELQRQLSTNGFLRALRDICGIGADEWLAGKVKSAYDAVRGSAPDG